MIIHLIPDFIWLACMIPALFSCIWLVRDAYIDRQVITERHIDGSILQLVNGAIEREWCTLGMCLIAVAIGIAALFVSETPQAKPKHPWFDTSVLLGLLGIAALLCVSSLRARHRRRHLLGLTISGRQSGSRFVRLGWLWRWWLP